MNTQDSQSVAVGEYYQRQRGIPTNNLIRVSFSPGKKVMTVEEFKLVQAQVRQQTRRQIQGYALSWTYPYRVACMSITSAFALGFDRQYCADSCKATAPHAYFNQPSSRPHTRFAVRPTMMLAGESIAEARALIDRGIQSDQTQPPGTAYLVSTKDRPRNVRALTYKQAQTTLGDRLQIDIIKSNTLKNRQDVMFYFTGLAAVNHLDTLQFRPGAIADHLTSLGGQLEVKRQMSVLRWLEAGATGSYGAVVEPCNFPHKFPNVPVLMQTYLSGATLIESYWRSVLWPGQGLFVGEPLARPFGKQSTQ